ncbi:PhaM family polyhydroxyalkanoate granule multifunctional regulatory protein [Limnobacter sp.]|uniref:PhaM family polyhydroxyalkanoate granule multifunctional regulatory protein n=1 Tax=Limnobacter sp. TaxID=2003368 RepID=UPI0025874E9F|nr:PhaM family polyhydroxyalkanoate granule multifunctional regulatory protein [Limnobacter sp.]
MSNKLIPSLSVTDGVDFVKKIWGSLPLPSVMTPTTDLEELDKRISDLKAVEQWLNVNLSMLRATIQGLEVQRGTIATIKSFGASLGRGGATVDKAGELDLSGVSSYMDEEILRKAVTEAVREASPPPVPSVSSQSKTPGTTSGDPTPEASKALISNATAWWGLLQDQFNKVAAAAISSGGAESDKSAKKTKSSAGKAATEKKPAASKSPAPRRAAARKSSTGRS